MSTLKFADSHNMVAFLAKPAKSEGFDQIVDFLNANPIKYALMVNPTIYTSFFLDKQVGDMSTHDRIFVTPSHTKKVFDNMKRVGKGFSGAVTPLFPTMMKKQKPRKPKRKDTKIPQSSGPTEPIVDEAANEENVPTYSNDPLLSGKDSLKLNDLMEICTKLQQRVLNLENTKTAQEQEISSLKLRVKRLEKKGGSRTHKLKRLFKVGRSASKQGRKINDIDKDAEVTLVDETQGRYDDDLVFDTSVLDGEEVFSGQDVVEKEVSTADPVTTAGEVATTASVEVSAARVTPVSSATIITTTAITEFDLTLVQALAELRSTKPNIVVQELDKDKDKMIEPEKPLKKKEQIRLDEELAFKLQAKEEEQARLAREKVKKVKEANISWDNVQAMIEADSQLKNKSFAEIQKLFDKAMTRVKMFVDMDTELVKESSKKAVVEMAQESSSKRAREELEQEVAKKQKMEDDKEKENLKQCFKIVQDDEVAIDVIPLATKPAPIVNFHIHRKGRQCYYEIIRADGSSKIYLLFSQLIKSFNREDLETLWKLVKAKHGNTRPEEGYKRVLWGDLKTMFEHHVEDLIWRNLQGKKVLLWRLYDSCGIHFVRFEDMHVYMLVEKRYPLTPATITDMLNKKLKSDYWNEMCYQLLKLITKQLKNQ
ncbi:hypothetical protein Tco_0828332 [Tanacetum coccineum]